MQHSAIVPFRSGPLVPYEDEDDNAATTFRNMANRFIVSTYQRLDGAEADIANLQNGIQSLQWGQNAAIEYTQMLALSQEQLSRALHQSSGQDLQALYQACKEQFDSQDKSVNSIVSAQVAFSNWGSDLSEKLYKRFQEWETQQSTQKSSTDNTFAELSAQLASQRVLIMQQEQRIAGLAHEVKSQRPVADVVQSAVKKARQQDSVDIMTFQNNYLSLSQEATDYIQATADKQQKHALDAAENLKKLNQDFVNQVEKRFTTIEQQLQSAPTGQVTSREFQEALANQQRVLEAKLSQGIAMSVSAAVRDATIALQANFERQLTALRSELANVTAANNYQTTARHLDMSPLPMPTAASLFTATCPPPTAATQSLPIVSPARLESVRGLLTNSQARANEVSIAKESQWINTSADSVVLFGDSATDVSLLTRPYNFPYASAKSTNFMTLIAQVAHLSAHVYGKKPDIQRQHNEFVRQRCFAQDSLHPDTKSAMLAGDPQSIAEWYTVLTSKATAAEKLANIRLLQRASKITFKASWTEFKEQSESGEIVVEGENVIYNVFRLNL